MQKQRSSPEPIGLLVAAVRRRIKQAVSSLVEGRSLTPQQFWTLVAVARRPGLSLGELAEGRRMDQPTACRVVDSLVRRRLVRKAPDPADRRRLRLDLTPGGAVTAAELLPIAARVGRAVEGRLTPAEREAVAAGLRKVLAGLDRFVTTVPARERETGTAERRRHEGRPGREPSVSSGAGRRARPAGGRSARA